MSSTLKKRYDVFLSYRLGDVVWVKALATRLAQEGFKVWFDEWELIPGTPFQVGMARGIEESKAFAVCISEHAPAGWCENEIQKAIIQQRKDESFRVIPILMPKSTTDNVHNFLPIFSWIDFRDPARTDAAFHALKKGIQGLPPGMYP